MTMILNQLMLFSFINPRTLKIAIFVLLTLIVLAVLLAPNALAFAGPATSDAGHCSC